MRKCTYNVTEKENKFLHKLILARKYPPKLIEAAIEKAGKVPSCNKQFLLSILKILELGFGEKLRKLQQNQNRDKTA